MADDCPLFSIIITTYFAENTIRKCMDSVLAQTETSYEIIVVDDASQDGTVAILHEYAARCDKIRLILHPENKGKSVGLNEGVRAAVGQYISIIDCDDWVSEDCYEKRKASLLAVPGADVLIAGYRVNYIEPQGENKGQYRKRIPPFPINQPLTFRDMVASVEEVHTKNLFAFSVRMLFRREFLLRENIFNREDMVVGEDADFNLRALNRAKTIVACDEVGYLYDIRNQGSVMRQPYKKSYENDMQLLYETRAAMCMDIESYRQDLIEYYVRVLTFLVIRNQTKSPEGLTPAALRRILNRPCFRETWKATGLKLYHKGFPDLILRLLIKFRLVHLYCLLVRRSQK